MNVTNLVSVDTPKLILQEHGLKWCISAKKLTFKKSI